MSKYSLVDEDYEDLVRQYQEGSFSDQDRKEARRLFWAVEMKIRRRVKKIGIKARRLDIRQTKGFFWTFTYPAALTMKTITLRDMEALRWLDAYYDD